MRSALLLALVLLGAVLGAGFGWLARPAAPLGYPLAADEIGDALRDDSDNAEARADRTMAQDSLLSLLLGAVVGMIAGVALALLYERFPPA